MSISFAIMDILTICKCLYANACVIFINLLATTILLQKLPLSHQKFFYKSSWLGIHKKVASVLQKLLLNETIIISLNIHERFTLTWHYKYLVKCKSFNIQKCTCNRNSFYCAVCGSKIILKRFCGAFAPTRLNVWSSTSNFSAVTKYCNINSNVGKKLLYRKFLKACLDSYVKNI